MSLKNSQRDYFQRFASAFGALHKIGAHLALKLTSRDASTSRTFATPRSRQSAASLRHLVDGPDHDGRLNAKILGRSPLLSNPAVIY
jgi:hypothetical protein